MSVSSKAVNSRSQTMSPSLSSSKRSINTRERSSLSESNDFKQMSLPETPSLNRRKRSVYGVCPRPKFGPKASLHQPSSHSLQYPTEPMLRWESAAENVMVIKKIHDPSLHEPFVRLVTWLVKERGLKVFVERNIEEEVMLDERMTQVRHNIVFFHPEKSRSSVNRFVDLVVCAGGDGTLIYASSLFQGSVPPIIAFHFGSLGFLLPFDFSHFQEHIDNTLKGREVSLVLRSRLIAVVSTCNLENCMEWNLHRMETDDHYLVLNEVVVDRGDAAYIVQLDLFVDDMLVTVVQGDGLIISTPTGSTAYSAAAGASMVHPNVPAIIITPICPHSLSFRPIVLPSGVQIKIMISPDARTGAWVSFDGRRRQNLRLGQMLVINSTAHPLPCVTYVDPVADWFNRLAGCLHWNVRKLQSSLQKPPNQPNSSHTIIRKKKDEIKRLEGKHKLCTDNSLNVNKRYNIKHQDNLNLQEQDDKVSVNLKNSQSNLTRFNLNYNRRKKIIYRTHNNNSHHHYHHHYRHSYHRRHLQHIKCRSSSLTDIQLSFLDIQNKLSLQKHSLEGLVGDTDGCVDVVEDEEDADGCVDVVEDEEDADGSADVVEDEEDADGSADVVEDEEKGFKKV